MKQAGQLVKKAEVDVEVHVGEIVLVAELQARDLHGCIQYACCSNFIQVPEDRIEHLSQAFGGRLFMGLQEHSLEVHWKSIPEHRLHKHSQGLYVDPGNKGLAEVHLEPAQQRSLQRWENCMSLWTLD